MLFCGVVSACTSRLQADVIVKRLLESLSNGIGFQSKVKRSHIDKSIALSTTCKVHLALFTQAEIRFESSLSP